MTKISMECFPDSFCWIYPAGDDAGSFAFRFGTLHGFRLCLKKSGAIFQRPAISIDPKSTTVDLCVPKKTKEKREC